jgi:hypothetical protein
VHEMLAGRSEHDAARRDYRFVNLQNQEMDFKSFARMGFAYQRHA